MVAKVMEFKRCCSSVKRLGSIETNWGISSFKVVKVTSDKFLQIRHSIYFNFTQIDVTHLCGIFGAGGSAALLVL